MICIDNVLTPAEVSDFRRQLEAAEWEEGIKSAGTLARFKKHNLQLPESSPLAISLGNEILRRLGNQPQFISAALPSKIYPPRFNQYAKGDTYGTHVDSAVMRIPGTQVTLRSDLSATLFLSDPDSYDGGELEIEGSAGAQAVKLEAGHLVIYPSSSLHRVTAVTRGKRYASFFWIESLVQDDAARSSLFDLDQAIQHLTVKLGSQDADLLALTNVYHNVLRQWART